MFCGGGEWLYGLRVDEAVMKKLCLLVLEVMICVVVMFSQGGDLKIEVWGRGVGSWTRNKQ
jgi:hypothetical protein